MLFLPPENTLHNTSSHTVSLSTAVLGEVTVCLCPQDGWTALHMAAQEGRVDVVRLLTEAQANLNIQTKVHTHSIMSSDCLLLSLTMKSVYMVHVFKHTAQHIITHSVTVYICTG